MRRRLAHQMRIRGIPHMNRPNQSPTLNTTKWSVLKRSGCIAGFVGRMDIVIAGKTDCRRPSHLSCSLLPDEVFTIYSQG
jgi:hypothetical protein